MSRSASDVTVVTVNWNGRHHLESLLPSLRPLGAGRILVVDNGSRDGSVEFLRREYPEVGIVENSRNHGFAAPCNAGAREASTPLVAFLNNDMRCHPEWIAGALDLLEEAPCVASRILDWEGSRADFNGSSLEYLGYALQKDCGRLAGELTDGDRILFPCGGAMLIDREVFLAAGGFDPDYFAIYEDVDLGWRLWVLGHEVRLAPRSIAYHRGHATFATRRLAQARYLMHRNALFTIYKNYGQEAFERILPAALVLAVKRAVRCSGVNRESFYMWSEREEALAASDPAAGAETLDALNHLVALEDFLDDLPRLREKRARVQGARRRSDAEIFRLFEDPLRPIVEDAEYLGAELDLVSRLGIDEFFPGDRLERAADVSPDRTPERLRRVRRELERLRQLGGRALQNPPAVVTASRARRFLDVARNQGLGTALSRAWRALRDG